MTDWTPTDRAAATREGWDIFDCDGSENGPVQIQGFDSPDPAQNEHGVWYTPPNINDMQAWRLVWDGLWSGSELHAKAYQFLLEHNPIEAEAISNWCSSRPPNNDTSLHV